MSLCVLLATLILFLDVTGGQILVKDSTSNIIKKLKQLDRLTERCGEYNRHISAALFENAHKIPIFT
jgi:hypothetical protein